MEKKNPLSENADSVTFRHWRLAKCLWVSGDRL